MYNERAKPVERERERAPQPTPTLYASVLAWWREVRRSRAIKRALVKLAREERAGRAN